MNKEYLRKHFLQLESLTEDSEFLLLQKKIILGYKTQVYKMICVAVCIRFLMMSLSFTSLNIFNFFLMTFVCLTCKLLTKFGSDDIFILHFQLILYFLLCSITSTEDNLKQLDPTSFYMMILGVCWSI